MNNALPKIPQLPTVPQEEVGASGPLPGSGWNAAGPDPFFAHIYNCSAFLDALAVSCSTPAHHPASSDILSTPSSSVP